MPDAPPEFRYKRVLLKVSGMERSLGGGIGSL